jgi:hypothetical protein
MTKEKKPRADSKLKNLPDTDQEAMWQLMHPADAETKAWSLEQVACHIQNTHGFSVALSTLSEWHSWYSLRRRMEHAARRANQTALELARNSDMTPEDIHRVAQTVFTAEALEQGDIKGYVALARLRQGDKSLEQRDKQLDQRDQELTQRETLVAQSERRVALLEAKAAQADAAKGVLGEALSPEEQNRRLREILK